MMSKVADDTKPEHIVFVVFKLVIERLTGHIIYGGSIEANQSVLAGIIAVVIVYSIPPIVLMVASHFINSTTEVVPNTQPISPAPVVTERNIEIEREYWISVGNHPSEEMYRLYLKKYPEGEFKDIALAEEKRLADAKRAAEQAEAKRIAAQNAENEAKRIAAQNAENEAKRIAAQNAKEQRRQFSRYYGGGRSSHQKPQPSVNIETPTIAERKDEFKLKPRNSAPHSRDDL